MFRRSVLLLSSLAALSTQAAGVATGSVGGAPVTVSNPAAGTTEKLADSTSATLSQAAKIAEDAVTIDSTEVLAGGVTTTRHEPLPVAAANRLGGLLRSKETLAGGVQVTQERNLSTLTDAARSALAPPFSHTRQQGRSTVTEKSYLPFPTDTSGLFNQTQKLEGGVTTTTTPMGQLQNLSRFYYTHKKLPGGVQSYGPPDLLPDSHTFDAITRVTERLPNGTTVTRDRALVAAMKNPSQIGFTTSSTDEKGVTIQKFHSLVPNAPVHMDWNRVKGAMGDEKAAQAAKDAPRNPDGSLIAVDPAYKAAYEKTEQTVLGNPAAQAVKNESASIWSSLNPIGWAQSVGSATKGLFTKAVNTVPSAKVGTGSSSFQNSLRANKGNVIRPGAIRP